MDIDKIMSELPLRAQKILKEFQPSTILGMIEDLNDISNIMEFLHKNKNEKFAKANLIQVADLLAIFANEYGDKLKKISDID